MIVAIAHGRKKQCAERHCSLMSLSLTKKKHENIPNYFVWQQAIYIYIYHLIPAARNTFFV
jgi:hypothetical protein